VVGGGPWLPDWRNADCYAALLGAGPEAFAWEWLRRDPFYRDAAQAQAKQPLARAGDVLLVEEEPAAARWGLHAFENPALPAGAARPVWRRAVYPRCLVAAAEAPGAPADLFDLAWFASLATVVRCDARGGGGGAEYVLLSDGLANLRLDVAAGSLLAGPVCLTWRLAGFAALDGPLATLHALMRLRRAGHLPSPSARSRTRRLVLLLRACDALQAGAGQREIARELLSAEAAQARWRTEAPSLRLQAQRLAGGARAMARGGYLSLLAA
jgi:hypothetical protein